jgi:hypothetical protein
MTTTHTAPSRNLALLTARLAAGLLGSIQLAGAVFFLFIAPEESVWVGLWLDAPIVALTLSGVLLKLGVAIWPRLHADRRIALGFLAIVIGVAVTLVKIPVYDEPEGVLFLAFDAALFLFLTLAWRTERR